MRLKQKSKTAGELNYTKRIYACATDKISLDATIVRRKARAHCTAEIKTLDRWVHVTLQRNAHVIGTICVLCDHRRVNANFGLAIPALDCRQVLYFASTACKPRDFNSETNSSSTDMRSNFSHDVCTFLGNQEQSIKNSLRSNLNTSFQPLFCQKIDANPSKKVLVEALGEHYSRACVSKENGWNQNRSPLEDAARLAYAGSRNVAKYSPAQCSAPLKNRTPSIQG
jgi:hypothetical protein